MFQIDMLVSHSITAVIWQATDIQDATVKYSEDGITWNSVTDDFGTEKVHYI